MLDLKCAWWCNFDEHIVERAWLWCKECNRINFSPIVVHMKNLGMKTEKNALNEYFGKQKNECTTQKCWYPINDSSKENCANEYTR
jgi:hypothetical protein